MFVGISRRVPIVASVLGQLTQLCGALAEAQLPLNVAENGHRRASYVGGRH